MSGAADSPTAAQRFVAALAGVDAISDRFARSAIDQARRRFGDSIDGLIDTFDRDGLEGIERSPHVGQARALAHFAYTGLLTDADGQPDDRPAMVEEDYFESVVWRVVQAHPRGLSGGYFGHWHYPPEDTDGAW